jgi:acyl carrier protein
MDRAEIDNTVRTILSRELNISAAEIGEATTVENNLLWDSVKHVDILFGLQDAFGIEFDQDEMDNMLSYSQIMETLLKRLPAAA